MSAETTPVLIPTRRRPHLLERQVKAIREQEGNFEPFYLYEKELLHYDPDGNLALELGYRTLDILWDLNVACLISQARTPYQGAETKSYNYDHLAWLWDQLFFATKDEGPPWIIMGSDVLPGEPDTLVKMADLTVTDQHVSLTVPVQVNEHGALNWFWAAVPGRREPYRATTDNTRFRDEVVPAARVTGGIIAFNYNPSPLRPGPGSEFYHLKNPCVYLGRTGINLRPDGQEWRIEK